MQGKVKFPKCFILTKQLLSETIKWTCKTPNSKEGN